MSKHAQTGQNQSPPDVYSVAMMTQSLCPNHDATTRFASPPDVYSIAMMRQSSSKVGNLLTGQISHDKIYYGQIVLLSYRKPNSKRVRLYARPKFPGFERGSVSSIII
jgi:hypothetical protein